MKRKTLRNIITLVAFSLIAVFGAQQTRQYKDQGTPSMQIGETLKGKVSRVVDGDSLYITNHKLRLWGVDAPETDERGYQQAKDTLSKTVLNKEITCTCTDIDRHGRSIVKCTTESLQDLSDLMVRSGWALDYAKHTHGFYSKVEDEARTHKRGLWGL